jgi:hypothetical protein
VPFNFTKIVREVGDPTSLKIAPLVDNDVIPLYVPLKNSTEDEPFKYTNGFVVDTVLPKESEFATTDVR